MFTKKVITKQISSEEKHTRGLQAPSAGLRRLEGRSNSGWASRCQGAHLGVCAPVRRALPASS